MSDIFPGFLLAWAALSAAAISPGPNMVAVASRGLGSGRRAALMVAFGIALGGFGWAILTSLGLSLLFRHFPVLLQILGIVGGCYLLWLGFKGWRSAVIGSKSDIAASRAACFESEAVMRL